MDSIHGGDASLEFSIFPSVRASRHDPGGAVPTSDAGAAASDSDAEAGKGRKGSLKKQLTRELKEKGKEIKVGADTFAFAVHVLCLLEFPHDGGGQHLSRLEGSKHKEKHDMTV